MIDLKKESEFDKMFSNNHKRKIIIEVGLKTIKAFDKAIKEEAKKYIVKKPIGLHVLNPIDKPITIR